MRFYLVGYKGYKVLKSILENYKSNIIYSVIIGRDNGMSNDYYNEIRYLCDSFSIHYIDRKHDLSETNMLSIAVGWRWLINLSRVPNLIILHDSILPKYRGFNPLVTALINGDTEIGVTALYASKLCDQGDIIYQSTTTIKYPIKIETAIDFITNNYCEVVLKIIDKIVNRKSLPRINQNNLYTSFSLWRDEEDYHINWDLTSIEIKRFIDAVGIPYKGAYSVIDNKEIRILDSEVVDDINIVNRSIGKVVSVEDEYPIVVCGQGLLKIRAMVKNSKEYKLKKFRVRFK